MALLRGCLARTPKTAINYLSATVFPNTMDWAFVISAFAAIFSIVNPLSKIIIFPIVTEGYSREEQMGTIALAIYSSFLIFVGFGLFGRFLFRALGVDYNALRLTGALVMIKIGFDMIQGIIPRTKPTPEEAKEVVEKRMVGVFPLAIPFISGPAAIITVMLYMAEAPGLLEGVMVIVDTAIVCIITLFVLLQSRSLYKKLGRVGVLASVRIMGMIILAIGFQLLLNALDIFLSSYGF